MRDLDQLPHSPLNPPTKPPVIPVRKKTAEVDTFPNNPPKREDIGTSKF